MLHDTTPEHAGRACPTSSCRPPRLDNLCSSWAGLEALLVGHRRRRAAAGPIPLLVLFDHEEIGSTSDRGAASTLLPAVTERIVLSLGGGRDEHLRALAGSVCCSADMAHATHPNYADKHEPGHLIALNGGPGAQGEQQRPLRQRRPELRRPRAGVRAGRRPAPALRPPQRPAVRLHHRSDHRRRHGHPHRRRRGPAARHALVPGAVRRRRPAPLRRRHGGLPRAGVARRVEVARARAELGLGPAPTWTAGARSRTGPRSRPATPTGPAATPRAPPSSPRPTPPSSGPTGRGASPSSPTAAPAASARRRRAPPVPPLDEPPEVLDGDTDPPGGAARRGVRAARRGVPSHRRRHLHRSVLRHPRGPRARSRARACAAW